MNDVVDSGTQFLTINYKSKFAHNAVDRYLELLKIRTFVGLQAKVLIGFSNEF